MTDVQKAIDIVKNGGIIIFPTDTVFGPACRIDDEQALKRLFKIKQRSATQSVPVLVDSVTMAQEYVQPIPKEVKEKLMDAYWPGGLTIVLPCLTEKVLPLVRGNRDTLAVRMPHHPLTITLIKEVGTPLVGTSANFHGLTTPTNQEEIDPELVELVDFVLPGECFKGTSSTIIDCSVQPWKILREGADKIPQNHL
ncbi:MAG TPA: L-threonylcarbamoyladenylate synthase [Candidatus Saccharimonadales bacterium]|nr:L-threonylcarbamoyladenylate synthase [Candidatus Saccharimonadales bacterium]